ncbi:glutamine synthetase [Streptomyces sp. NBC_00654]|uniref:glutamine synthetase n=1 Tax=Streptomyces sp. NBC_00654 TaxID=2975799 RepID=UPI00224E1681|nr:glutamine synthetase [Streptomyces sp. NBC_00654]MCX4965751.1 glutamine synthetase [Streptomyces sp. NBC_00654]
MNPGPRPAAAAFWQRPTGPRTLAARAGAGATIREELAARAPSRLTLLAPDPHARFAAVDLDGAFALESVLDDGYGACTYLCAWTVERGTSSAPELQRYYGTYSDLVLRPDPATLLPQPDPGDGLAEEGSWYVVCDAAWPDGRPVTVAPRTVLRQRLAAAEALGIVPSVGLEHEVTFHRADGSPLTAHGIDYALGGTENLAPLLREIRSTLRGAALGVESARAECHPGQYEIVLRHRDALAACDDAMVQQTLVRQAAARHGVTASYLAAEGPGQGSSCHVHLSLNDVDGHNLGPGAGDPRRPGPLLGAFLAGVLRAAGDLTPIWAPTVNSYVRLRTGDFAPTSVRWGADDRTAAVRLAGHGPSLRLECRFPGADAQPHLAVAALLAAGLSGIEDGLPLPPPGKEQDRLPTTPWQALDRFSTSPLPVRLLDAELVDHCAALFRAELDDWCDGVTDWQRRRGALRS